MSGLASGTPLLLNASKVSVPSQGGVCFSCHLSGIVNGFTQVIALAADASAVAVAAISAVAMPKYFAIIVGSGLPRAAVRYTVTFTRLGSPAGSLRNSTSAGFTETSLLMTLFDVDAASALVTAGPDGVRSVQLSYTRAVAPASAPASAAFCAWLRAVISMPTSMASMLALMKAIML